MRKILSVLGILPIFLLYPSPVFAVDNVITDYTNNTLSMITAIAMAAAVFFLVKGGYSYITASGKPESLEQAKRTIKNALIGLSLVLASRVFVSILTNSIGLGQGSTNTSAIPISPIDSVQPKYQALR